MATKAQIWNDCFQKILTGNRGEIQTALDTLLENKIDINIKMKKWLTILPELSIESLVKFFSVKSLTIKNYHSRPKRQMI